MKTKYITYTIEADNLKAARARLSRISLDIQGYFKIMGAVSRVLDGKERLEVLHGIMHPDGERFNFDWKWPCRWRAFHQGLYRAVLLCVQE